MSDPMPTTTPGTLSLPEHRPDQRTFLERVVHDPADASENGRKDAEAQRTITLGRRHQRCFVSDRTHTVIRVVIAES